MRQRFHELVGLFAECGYIAVIFVLQIKLETIAHAVSGNHRGRHGEYGGIGDVGSFGVYPSDYIVHRLPVTLAFVPILERDKIHGL